MKVSVHMTVEIPDAKHKELSQPSLNWFILREIWLKLISFKDWNILAEKLNMRTYP